MLNKQQQRALAGLLDWAQQMGSGELTGETPVNWLAREDAVPGAGLRTLLRGSTDDMARAQATTITNTVPAPSVASQSTDPGPVKTASPSPASPSSRRFPTTAPDQAVMSAREAARSAASLRELADILSAFDGCALKATAKSLCFYRGADEARIMVIGEAPGRDEDLAGKPFVGRAGQLLDKMLASIGLDESNCHITNIVYWRPPGNRTPTPQEAQICRPFLERQIKLVRPDILFLLGGAAAKNILNSTSGIMKLRGKWHDVSLAAVAPAKSQDNGKETTGQAATSLRALATLHPAYLLRTPAAKRLAWRDLLMIRSALEEC